MPAVRAGLANLSTVGQSNAQVSGGSLLFIRGDTASLKRTPGSAGNRRTWTWSGWLKRGEIDTAQFFFGAGPDGSNDTDQITIFFEADNQLRINTGNSVYLETTQVFRDIGWYHFVIATDTTLDTANDRVKLYVNGSQVIYFDTRANPTKNSDTGVDSATEHKLGEATGSTYAGSSYTFDGSMAEVYLIDGQALSPSEFGFTDPLTNTWRPKKYQGAQAPNRVGKIFSTNFAASDSFQATAPAINAFNGGFGTVDQGRAACSSSGCTITLSSIDVEVKSKLEIWSGYGSASVNGGTAVNYDSSVPGWQDLSFTGALSSIVITGASGVNAGELYAVRVDGVILVDGGGYGITGSHLPLDGSAAIGTDQSGRGNDWTATNITDADVSPESPSGCSLSSNINSGISGITTSQASTAYCTWDELATVATLSEGNLKIVTAAAAYDMTMATIGMTSGKWYWEGTWVSGDNRGWGVGTVSTPLNDYLGSTGSWGYMYTGVKVRPSNQQSSYGDSFTTGDIISIAFDADTGTIWFAKNGTWQNSATKSEIESGITTNAAFTGLTDGGRSWSTRKDGKGPFFPYTSNQASSTGTKVGNFGQTPFQYQPPRGFLALNLANMESPKFARPETVVGVTSYIGDGTSVSVTDLKFSPDLVWIKGYTDADRHGLYDTLRGVTKRLQPSEDSAEDTVNGVMTFQPNGFTVGDYADTNGSGRGYVAWNWKAGGSKNTFNVDDRGYATAAEVNMSVGSLNSGVYNQDQDWSENTTNSAGNTTDPAMAFKGDFFNTGFGVGTGFANLTDKSFTVKSQIGIWVRDFGIGFNITIEYNGVEYTSVATVSNWVYFDVPASTNSGTLKVKCSSSGDEMRGVSVDGVILVDDDVTPPSLPSIAPSAASVGTREGFSIIKYTGAGSGSSSLPHGLLQPPDFIITKDLDSTSGWWAVYHSGLRADKCGYLNDAQAFGTHMFWAGVEPGSQTTGVYSIGANANTNSSNNFISYIWHNVPGLQQFGSYTGFDVTDGPFLNLGFRPAIIMFKNITDASTEWVILDDKRYGWNGALGTNLLFPSTQDAQNTTQYGDFVSNGFKIRINSGYVNSSSATFIYAAWAHQPMNNLYGGQSNAR